MSTQQDRLARYAELRDAGMNSFRAALEIGIKGDGTRQIYERWYRRERGMPPPVGLRRFDHGDRAGSAW